MLYVFYRNKKITSTSPQQSNANSEQSRCSSKFDTLGFTERFLHFFLMNAHICNHCEELPLFTRTQLTQYIIVITFGWL